MLRISTMKRSIGPLGLATIRTASVTIGASASASSASTLVRSAQRATHSSFSTSPLSHGSCEQMRESHDKKSETRDKRTA